MPQPLPRDLPDGTERPRSLCPAGQIAHAYLARAQGEADRRNRVRLLAAVILQRCFAVPLSDLVLIFRHDASPQALATHIAEVMPALRAEAQQLELDADAIFGRRAEPTREL